MTPHDLSRRAFVKTSAALAGAALLDGPLPAFLWADEPKPATEPVAFFLVGDTHFLADKEDTAKLDERSKLVTGRLVDLLNKCMRSADHVIDR